MLKRHKGFFLYCALTVVLAGVVCINPHLPARTWASDTAWVSALPTLCGLVIYLAFYCFHPGVRRAKVGGVFLPCAWALYAFYFCAALGIALSRWLA